MNGQGSYSEGRKIVVITSAEIPEIEITTCGEIVVNKGNEVSWYRDDQLMSDIPQGQKHLYPKGEGEYFITESTACGDLISNVIEVFPQDPIFIPNIITSNGDVCNQTFIVDSRLNHPELTILSRWGEIVYHTPVYNNDWSGNYISSGVYYYVIQNPCSGKDIKGPITVVNNN